MEAGFAVLTSSSGEAEIISKALSVDKKPGFRSSCLISAEGPELRILIKAEDLGALRAAVNSKLREVKVANSVL
jgi:tRNA threonylcarbamoyladenosine modification (KEOPS) complex  Pcc1 subunit